MLSLRLFRLCSVHAMWNEAPILQESYKVYKVTRFRSLYTETRTRAFCGGSVKMGSRGNQVVEKQSPVSYQNVVVMRHGERFDNFEPSWAATAARPWDPPLAEAGRKRAFETGWRLRQSLGFPIQRVFVSPFLRCVQTAVQLVASLSAVDEGRGTVTSNGVTVDPSKVKVSVEYGLCEMMNSRAIRPNVAPKDGNMNFDIAKCEAMLPAGTVDKNVERVYKELPQWEETVLQAGARYQQLIKDLADRYLSENLLLVTHGEGVKVAVSSFRKDAAVNEADYCGYVELRRPIFKEDHAFTTGSSIYLLVVVKLV
ncbi:Histidine phosphatase superfamily, clade-1 [Spatholobus suberectus]|nr:Histidine phosphatase superfamily, clade-1 [Spatholobus suberectus]